MSGVIRRILSHKTAGVDSIASFVSGTSGSCCCAGLSRLARTTWNSGSLTKRHFAESALGYGDAIPLTFIAPDGTRMPVKAPVGDTLLEVAHDNKIEIEGACGGECACSTCHVILPKDYYEKLDSPSEEEEDMLDLAAGLTETSRLCCQVVVEPELQDMEIQLPEEVNNML